MQLGVQGRVSGKIVNNPTRDHIIYGTEVLFKPKKVTTVTKPRTLASRNMRVKSLKQNNMGAKVLL